MSKESTMTTYALCRYIVQDDIYIDWKPPISDAGADRMALQLYAAVSEKNASLLQIYTDIEMLLAEEVLDTSPVSVTFFTVGLLLADKEVSDRERYASAINAKVLEALGAESMQFLGYKKIYGHRHLYLFNMRSLR